METPREIKLGSVQETLLLPLWGRAVETQKKKPLLVDEKAVSVINTIPYDFSLISKNINKRIRVAPWVIDKTFIKNHAGLNNKQYYIVFQLVENKILIY